MFEVHIKGLSEMIKVERRGGYRGGNKLGHVWKDPGISYTYPEQEARERYLSAFKGRIDSYRQVMLEPGCKYQGDDSSYETMLYAVRSQVQSKDMRTLVPTYPVRYQEYLKGNNSVS